MPATSPHSTHKSTFATLSLLMQRHQQTGQNCGTAA
jgi:hypothetical protein